MFGIGQFASLLKNMPKVKEEMERLQQRISQITAEGDAGAGMVKARVNGQLEILSCTISEEAMKLNDREMLEDLVVAAVNQALHKARQQTADETGKMAISLGLPPGMNLPGLQLPGS
jgi:DNA-binding YbaB/EbfC family protein